MKELIYKKSFENKKVLNNIFIPTNKKWESTENDNLSVIESGKNGVLFNKIINDINSAQTMICLQSFLIQDTSIIDALLKAKQDRGVRVFVMGCAEAKLESNPYGEEDSSITRGYKAMLDNKFKKNFNHRQAGDLHAKFILIDPKTKPKGFIFTGNFNEKPFFENPELAVELSELQVRELFKVFVYHFWEHTTDEQTERKEFEKVKPINKFSLESLNETLLTSPNSDLSNLKKTLLESISKAKEKIQFSTFGLDINHELSKSILEKLKKGVKVIIYCRPRLKAIKDHIEILSNNGAEVICHPLIHAKSLIVDNTIAFVFSANFENHGMNKGFEVGVKLSDQQKNDLLKIYDNFKNTFPYKYFSEVNLLETHSYQEFDGKTGRLKPIISIKDEEIKPITKEIARINELVDFFTIQEPKYFQHKLLTIKAKAEINILKKEKYTKLKSINNEVELVEVQQGTDKKKKTEKVLLLDLKEGNNILNLLPVLAKDYRNFKIYAK